MRKVASFVFFLGLLFLFGATSVNAATYTVSKTADTNDGTCDADCSFREAVAVANGNSGADTVEFNIPEGDGGYVAASGETQAYWLITTTTQIALTDDSGVYINGYTQTGASRNTASFGETLNTILTIRWFQNQGSLGFSITGDNNHIAGLNISALKTENSIEISTSINNWIEGIFFGSDITGTTASNGGSFSIVSNSSTNTFGTNGDGEDDLGEKNLFAGTAGGPTGIGGYVAENNASVGGSNVVAGNYFGTDKTGRTCTSKTLSNGSIQFFSSNNRIGTNYDGISDSEEANIIGCTAANSNARGFMRLLSSSSNNLVQGNYIGISPYGDALGSLASVSRAAVNVCTQATTVNNTFKGNTVGNGAYGFCFYVAGTGSGNTVQQNKIYNNSIKDISITPGSVLTPLTNDPGDIDSGPNELMNYPIIDGAVYLGGGRYRIGGYLDGNSSEAPYTIEVCKTSGHTTNHGGCNESLGLITLSSPGPWSMEVTTGDEGIGGYPTFTSLATNSNGSTSEFGPNFTATSGSSPNTFASTADFLSLRSGVVQNKDVIVVALPNTFNMDVKLTVDETKKTGIFKIPGTLYWQAGSVYEVRFKSFFNDFEISSIDVFHPFILAVKYDLTSLESTLPEKNLRLAFSVDGKKWKILPSVLNIKNKTAAVVTKNGGYFMLVSGYQ